MLNDTNGVKYYKFKEACKVMGVSESFLRRLQKAEAIKYTKYGSRIWFSSKQIQDFFDKFEVKQRTVLQAVPKGAK